MDAQKTVVLNSKSSKNNMSAIIKNDKKIIRAWTFYDWANSVYPLIISSAIFPIFFERRTQAELGGVIHFLGCDFVNTAFYSYVVALSYLIVAFTSPLLSGVADYSGNKKGFLRMFCFLGAISSMLLTFFNTNYIGLSMFALLLASVGYWGSLVFYNAYLPEIASEEYQDKVSAKGYALGYLGSSILLVLILVLKEALSFPIQYAFLLVGLWWIGFAQYTLFKLPDTRNTNHQIKNPFSKGFKELTKVLRDLKDQPRLKRFLYSYFFYNMGVQTVMIMAVPFAAKEIRGLQDSDLIVSILLIQFLGIAGSFLMSKLSSIFGNLNTLTFVIFLWVLICVIVYFFVYTPVSFYWTASSIGLVMGGIQALSRSTYSKFLPNTDDTASYFSFYDVSEKIGLAIGTTTFGFIEDATGGIRNSVLALVTFFAVGFVLLFFVPRKPNKVVN
jgi:MFS transporter, UMF1 family